jgi:hypothetical protein
MQKAQSWKKLEAMGLQEIVMVERVKALRALANCNGGALSRKKRPPEPASRELVRLLRELIVDPVPAR